MDKEKFEQLYQPFELHSRPGMAGRTFKYVKGEDVIDRMNKVFAGRWGTDILDQEIINEEAVVSVLVTIYEEDNLRLSHVGFGSSSLKGGNVGDSYKSALTNAIKNACRKWGVGLYLEEEADGGEEGVPSFTPPTTPNKDMSKTEPVIPSRSSSSTPNVSNTPKEEPKEEVKTPKMPNLPPFINNSPPNKEEPPIVEAPKEGVKKEKSEPVDKPAQSFPKIPLPSAPKPSNGTAGGKDDEKISDVQKAALKGLVTIRGLDYNQLVNDAFSSKGIEFDKVPDADDLSYKEAVIVIKHGNDLFKKK